MFELLRDFLAFQPNLINSHLNCKNYNRNNGVSQADILFYDCNDFMIKEVRFGRFEKLTEYSKCNLFVTHYYIHCILLNIFETKRAIMFKCLVLFAKATEK